MTSRGLHPWLLTLFAVFIGYAASVRAEVTLAGTGPDASELQQLFDKAENLKSADNAQFKQLIARIASHQAKLAEAQRWHLRYLEAWQKDYDGDLDSASNMLVSIIDDGSDSTLRFRATATLINILGVSHRYEAAYMRLNELMVELPKITDKAARFQGLGEAAQLLSMGGQYDLASDYADQMLQNLPRGEGVCKATFHGLHARFKSGTATAADPDYQAGIDACEKSGLDLWANGIRADVAAMYLRDGLPRKAVVLLQSHYDRIRQLGYRSFTSQVDALLGRAFLAIGDLDRAKQYAVAAVSSAPKKEFTEPLSTAEDVLYQVARRQGDIAAALSWHEKYMAADKGYLNDITARALAYQRVKQQVEARRQQVNALNNQNRILQLQQALDRKAVQASRLSIILLLTILASIGFWLYRLKRSQKRFMRLARHDGLTGIFNRQHFVEQAEQALSTAKKAERDACLILIDLDHFKLINDSYGHAVGDLVLKRAVGVCHDHLRATDIFGRLGGEEFGILLPDCSLSQVVGRAEAMRVTISSMTGDADTRGSVVSASLGIASTEYSGYELRALMADADGALYRAKRGGRNRVVLDGVTQADAEQTAPA